MYTSQILSSFYTNLSIWLTERCPRCSSFLVLFRVSTHHRLTVQTKCLWMCGSGPPILLFCFTARLARVKSPAPENMKTVD
jgi:hypothetical protein